MFSSWLLQVALAKKISIIRVITMKIYNMYAKVQFKKTPIIRWKLVGLALREVSFVYEQIETNFWENYNYSSREIIL